MIGIRDSTKYVLGAKIDAIQLINFYTCVNARKMISRIFTTVDWNFVSFKESQS
jgi:hypothetical protein